ncbi:hypothetical protein DSM104299_02176 [Baekduia alba]|uniref:SRPBCC family protein n=1 Tax=Baekduia alba TaxID=2997333 RepID=UPI0023427384|nr:SRPBCC family protein [Baekduia alba]WCB93463.1 hypothetical protein DSM104299_02176 [Baekduia alba]
MRLAVTGRLARRRDEVFAYISDLRTLPEWSSAVRSVTPRTPARPTAGARYVMRRDLPSGPATNELELVAIVPSSALTLRTVDGPTPFTYHYTLDDADDGGTVLALDAEVELGRAAALTGPLAAGFVRRGLEANFATLAGVLDVR